jgi:hypothetical protein
MFGLGNKVPLPKLVSKTSLVTYAAHLIGFSFWREIHPVGS